MRTRREIPVALLFLLATLGCKSEPSSSSSPKPVASPSVSAPSPAFVQLRPRDSALGDPASANPRMAFDLAVGAAGKLRIELVDRVNGAHAMAFEPRDPRCLFITEVDIKPPRAALELKFENREGTVTVVSTVEAGGKRSEETAAIPNARRGSPGARLKAGVVEHPVPLPGGTYVPIAGFAWSANDAAITDALMLNESASEPHWILRVQFRPGT